MKIPVLANLDLIGDGCAVASFEHPDYGHIEQEIALSLLPPSAKQGDSVELLVDKVRTCRTMTAKAHVEWFDEPDAVTSFNHPTLGHVERCFKRTSLPDGAAGRDEFDLIIELSDTGRVTGYNPQRIGLKKYVLKEWEKIPRPPLPQDPDNKEDMEKYITALNAHTMAVMECKRKHYKTTS